MTTEYRHMLAEVEQRIAAVTKRIEELGATGTTAAHVNILFYCETERELLSLRFWLMERESKAVMQADDELDSDRIRQEQAGLR